MRFGLNSIDMVNTIRMVVVGATAWVFLMLVKIPESDAMQSIYYAAKYGGALLLLAPPAINYIWKVYSKKFDEVATQKAGYKAILAIYFYALIMAALSNAESLWLDFKPVGFFDGIMAVLALMVVVSITIEGLIGLETPSNNIGDNATDLLEDACELSK